LIEKNNCFDIKNLILDIMVASSRLHREADRFHYRANPIDNVMDFPSNHYLSYLKRNNNYVMPRQVIEEEEPETVYVNMKVDSEEEQPETQYVNLFINSK
jgi:hypothetical protein